jgi:hypothetical protein
MSPYHTTLRPNEIFTTPDIYVNVNLLNKKDRTIIHTIGKVIKTQKTITQPNGSVRVVESGLIEVRGNKIITDSLPINGAFYIKESEPQILKPDHNP